MAVVDYELAWLKLKEYALSKGSHGQRDLVHTMSEIEVGSQIPEEERGFDGTPPPHTQPAVAAPAGNGVMATH